MTQTEEALVRFIPSRDRVGPLLTVRSTLLTASLRTLRKHGFEERYFRELPADHHESIRFTPPGIWVPVAVAEAHYDACDRMGLAPQEILAIGNEVGLVTQNATFAMILRLAKGSGATPWLLFENVDRGRSRIFQGSGIATVRIGPKEARFEVAGSPLSRSSYWRVGLRGLLIAVTLPFAASKTVYVRELPTLAGPTTCGFRISWV
jgi:hypothetical protein